MLSNLIEDSLLLGLAQAVVASAVCLVVVGLAAVARVRLAGDTLWALARGLVQVVAAGAILMMVFQGPGWIAVVVLAAMIVAAASISRRRAQGMPGAFRASLIGVGLGAGSVIALMTALGVIDPALTHVIPVGSMLVAGGMNANGLALNRFHAEVVAHSGQIEAALALGASPGVAVAPHVQAAVHAALIPSIDTLRSLGIVWIPGIMAGMILAGKDPLYAAVYQFVVIAMLYSAGGITVLVSSRVMRTSIFTRSEQLVLRPSSRESGS